MPEPQKRYPAERLRGKSVGLIIRDRTLLLIRQNDNDTFGLPGGGIEEGESIEEALKREVLEETNCIVTGFTYFGTYLSGNPEVLPRRLANITFLVEADGVPQPSNEIEELRFFSFEEAISPNSVKISATVILIIEDCRKKGLL